MRNRLITILALILGLVLIVGVDTGQAGLGGLKDKLKKKVEKKADDKVDQKMDDAVDKAAGDAESQSNGEQSGGESGGGAATETGGGKPGEGVWVNYDFIPGDKVIFFDDFSKTPVGDFPSRIEFKDGNMEVAEWKGQRFLRATTDSHFDIPLAETLPQRFTLEFDYYGPTSENTVEIWDGTDYAETNSHLVYFWYNSSGVRGQTGGKGESETPPRAKERIAHCRAMGDGKFLKVYVNETRVANIPNSSFGRSDRLEFKIWARENEPLLITNVRIAAGGKKILYDDLMASGRVATQGIYFDSGSDNIRGESTPTLKEIGSMLKEHADLKLLIEGHTDNVGDDASNQTLSDKRAAAVKAYLVQNYQVSAERLQTKGFGETKPVASNDTPEGRQNNRRVELVKL